MKHTYTINGMTCDNCKQEITTALLAVPEITGVEINREKSYAEISMSSHVQTPVMQEALNKVGSYSIAMDTEVSMRAAQHNNHLKDLLPLFIIFGIILLFSVIITYSMNQDFSFGMRMFMGGFFVVFGMLKVLKLKNFAIAYKEYDILAMRSDTYAYLYPFIELGLGVLYFTNVMPFLTNILTIVVMGIGAVGVYLKLRKKEEIPCACLGTVFKVPMTWVTLFEDLLMVVMAMVMLLLM